MTGRKHRADWWIVIVVLSLLVIGTIVISAIGPRVAQFQNVQEGTNFGDSHYFSHHLRFVALGIIAMFLMMADWRPFCNRVARVFLKRNVEWSFNFELLERCAFALMTAGAVLCLAIPILGKMGASFVTCDLGACRSFRVPGLGFGFQAVEFFKLAALIYLSSKIAKCQREGKVGQTEFWVPIGLVAVITLVAVCWLQKDLGSTVVIFAMIFAMAVMAGAEWKQIGMLLGAGLLAAAVMILIAPHRLQRLMGFTGEGDSYHLENSLIGIGTGGLTGVGIGNSIQATGYLPESVSDSIFAIICEVFGFVGALAVLGLYIILLVRILNVARHTEDCAMRMAVVAVFAWIFAHVIINILGMIGVIPMKGITLVFLSYGGTSLLFSCAAVGLVLQISTWTSRKEIDEDTSSGRGERRSRNASDRRRA